MMETMKSKSFSASITVDRTCLGHRRCQKLDSDTPTFSHMSAMTSLSLALSVLRTARHQSLDVQAYKPDI